MNTIEEREAFMSRCLNAAANLYGVLTVDEFVGIYNGFAGNHESPICLPTNVEEVTEVIDRLVARDEGSELTFDFVDVWCGRWHDKKSGIDYIVYSDLLDDDDPDGRVMRTRAKWVVPELRLLTEEQLLAYEDPEFGEECSELEALSKLLEQGGDPCDMTNIDASAAQAQLRVNDASIEEAILWISDYTECRPEDESEYMKLVTALSKLANVTRVWSYRGYTQQELARAGRMPRISSERVPTYESVFGDGGYEDEDDEADDDYEADDDKDFKFLDDLPPAKYTGPVDFAFVKDTARRERALADYHLVRYLTKFFVRTFVMHEMTTEERKAAYRRLGFDMTAAKDGSFDLARENRDMVAVDFGSMLDDQNGEPAIRRLLTQGVMDKRSRKAADYFENYRYTWLEVLAVKAGVGMKCRDLLTGDELFLMECSLSQNPNVKGKTLCCGIAPIGEVYMAPRVVQVADFENPSVIIKIVLTHLGIPTELPVSLSFADQARFAEETIRRLDANGKIANGTIYI